MIVHSKRFPDVRVVRHSVGWQTTGGGAHSVRHGKVGSSDERELMFRVNDGRERVNIESTVGRPMRVQSWDLETGRNRNQVENLRVWEGAESHGEISRRVRIHEM